MSVNTYLNIKETETLTYDEETIKLCLEEGRPTREFIQDLVDAGLIPDFDSFGCGFAYRGSQKNYFLNQAWKDMRPAVKAELGGSFHSLVDKVESIFFG